MQLVITELRWTGVCKNTHNCKTVMGTYGHTHNKPNKNVQDIIMKLYNRIVEIKMMVESDPQTRSKGHHLFFLICSMHPVTHCERQLDLMFEYVLRCVA